MQGPNLIRTCSIWRSLDVVGDTPTLLILEASWQGIRRFDDLRARTGLLKALLSDRLKRLVEAGLFAKRSYSARPPRFEYVLTDKGRDTYWIALMLARWETLWGEGKPKIVMTQTHRCCGNVFTPEPICGHCGTTIDAADVETEEGPGVGTMAARYSRRRQQRDSSHGAVTLLEEAAPIMGDRWASLVMRSIFTGINRFEDIRQDTAIATNILSERLRWLESIGMIRPHAYPSQPPRHEYRATDKGLGYYPVLLMLMRWGDRYYVSPEGPPVTLTHKVCDKTLDQQVVCSCCRKPVLPEDVSYVISERKRAAA